MTKQEFNAFYAEYSRRLRSFILWMVRNRQACDDILQTVCIKVWNGSDLPPIPRERELWVLAIARNACLDYFRKGTRQRELQERYTQEFMPPTHDPDAKFAWEALAELTDCERSILYLHFKMGYTFGEIGTMLGLSESHVRVKSFRALKQVRKQLSAKEA